jgi:quercetin dioxygenase-like cupin family protein
MEIENQLNLKNIDNFVEKGWGHEIWVANSPLYCGKILKIIGGKKFSWHYHNLKDETFFCLEGNGVLYHSENDCMVDGKFEKELAEKTTLLPGTAFYMKPGIRHQFIATETTYLMEVSTQHFEEDSIKLEKGN